ncbi:hypothetical protein jhhlp_000428 [Lomentospora prolificans]|uniref:EKC/KEOPS complex subunit GON7 n=1 Tax=Lomentospora prolificans TaxID=41688 RepID=A0A2N3NKX1_9PEZI|nr:hypothetical protein jhhlp_000428 [Lomentospora prolificans]
MSSATPPSLSATYSSPTSEPFTISQQVSIENPADPASYLASLRAAATSVQDDINKELTRRMEEDKGREADSSAALTAGASVDEAKEEENYGEEVAEDDDEI